MLQTGQALAMFYEIPDGVDVPEHAHGAQWGVVLEGTIGLELDDGVEVTLAPGDVVVQNGTRHRWHNRGDAVARLLSVTIGAHHRIEGGGPV